MLKSALNMPIRGGRSRRNSNDDEIFSRETSLQNEHAKDGRHCRSFTVGCSQLHYVLCGIHLFTSISQLHANVSYPFQNIQGIQFGTNEFISLQNFVPPCRCRTFNMLSKTKDVLRNIKFDDFTYWNPEWMDYYGGYQLHRRLLKMKTPGHFSISV